MVLLSVVESCAVVRKSNYVSFSGGNGRKEGRKEMFYLTTHSTHFILRLHGVGYHSDSESRNPLPPH